MQEKRTEFISIRTSKTTKEKLKELAIIKSTTIASLIDHLVLSFYDKTKKEVGKINKL